ncbi:phage tail protein [Chryseobacterium phocaeense]|uniref:phage tail protein n=1 Tax=Chryseobacterium phocaeense TaxID=1816690 RepID=UPI0009B959F8|nr:DNA/RNA non-specific endonuclease [Chryseobacterium phocaeense]
MKAEKITKKTAASRSSKKYFFGAKKKLRGALNKESKAVKKPAAAPKPVKKEEKDKKAKTPAESLRKPFKEIEATAKKYQKHKDPQKVSDEKYDAALLPSEQANTSVANRHHLDIIPDEKKEFKKSAFKEKLQKQINETIESKSDAKKVATNGVAKSDTDKISESLQKEKEAAGGEIESGTIEPPNKPLTPKNEITSQEPVALIQEKPESKTQTTQKANLAPVKKTEEETDFTKETKTLDDQYSQNNLSTEKLQNSNEPSFIAADGQKTESQAKAQELTNTYRKDENKAIAGTKSSNEKAMNAAYASMLQNNSEAKADVFSSQNAKSKEENATRETIRKGLDEIFTRTNTKVLEYFKTIDDYIEIVFGNKMSENLNKFSDRVADLLDENTGFFNELGAAVTGDELLSEKKIFDIAKKEFIENMQTPIDDLVKVVDNCLFLAAAEVKKGKAEKDKFWKQQPDKDKKIAGDIFDEANTKFEGLESSIESKQESIIDAVTEKFSAAMDELDSRFEKAKIENMSWLDRAIAAVKSVINTIIELKNAIQAVAKKAAKYAEAIIDDPITFFGNLADAVGQGFTNFKNNIDKHLIKGVLQWLTGSIGDEIILPKELNLEGITSLVLQILGISIKKIKQLVIDVIGQERFNFIEKGVDMAISAGNKILDIFRILNEKGLAGLWEFIKEEFSDLKEMLIENVKTFVVETITQKAMEYLLSLLIPGAGFIRAAQLLIKFVVTLFQKAAQIVKIIDGILDTFGDILNKNLSAVTQKVEDVFSNFLSLAISFLAAVLGLDGIVGKVQKFIQQKIRPKIDAVLKKIALKIKQIAEKIGLMKLIDKSMKAVEKGKAWVDDKKKKAKDTAKKYGEKLLNFLKIRKTFKSENGETHTLYFKGKDENVTLMVASNPKTFTDFLKQIGTVKGNKAKVKKDAETEFDALQTALSKKNMGATDEEYKTEQTKKYEKVTQHVTTLSNYMPPLFDIEGIGKFELNFGSLNKSGYGTKMEVKNLHKSTKPPIGSVPGVSNDSYDTLRKKRNGGSTYYILGHLLNHNLGGSGNDFRNLTPLTRKGNKDHNVDIEEKVKEDLKVGKVINYTVVPNYGSLNEVKRKPANLSAKKKIVVDAEEKTPVTVNYIFESWDKEKPTEKFSKTDSFNNETDFKNGTYED